MRVLLGTTFLNCLSGSELFVYDVARGLSARGHEVTVWVRDLVPAAPLPRLLAHHGVRTTRDLPEDGGADAVIFQLKETFPVFASRHLDVPRLAICHGPKLPAEVAPADFPGTVHVALTREGEEYLVSAGYEQVAFTGYGIDLGRFSAMGEPPQRLRRAVAHSKYADMEVIRGACEELGIELTVLGRESWRPGFDLDHYADLVLVGEDGSVTDLQPEIAAFHVERLIVDADVVFGMGRSAVEALAMGKACVVFGYEDVGDGLVTPDRIADLARVNFSGRQCGRSFTAGDLAEELRAHSPGHAARNRGYVRRHYDLETFLDRVERLLLVPDLAGWRRRGWRSRAAQEFVRLGRVLPVRRRSGASGG